MKIQSESQKPYAAMVVAVCCFFSCAPRNLIRSPSIPIESEKGRFALTQSNKKAPLTTVKPSQISAREGIFRLPTGLWVQTEIPRLASGFPKQMVIRIPDQKWRISLFETRFMKADFSPKELDLALAFLFKLDPSPTNTLQIGRGVPRLYLPPTEGPSHLGLALADDTSLTWVHIEATDSVSLPEMKLWADSAFDLALAKESRQMEPSTAEASFLAAIENTLGLNATQDSAYEEATKRFLKAFTLDSLNPSYLANLAAMDQAQKQTPNGIQRILAHKHLLEGNGSSDLAGVLGGLYEELGDYEKAKQCAIKALEADPNNREWLINLSDALWGMGERVQSKNVLLRRYAEAPDFRLLVYLASTYLGLEEYENARVVLENARNMGVPDAKSVEYTLRAFVGLKDFAAAQDYAHSLKDSLPQTAMIRFLLAVTAFNLKQYRSALNDVQSALTLDANLREAQELSTQITTLLGGKSNRILRTPLTPLKTTLNLKEDLAKLKDASLMASIAEFPIALMEQNIAFSWVPGMAWRKTRHQLFYIPDGRRLLQFSELNYELNPTSVRFFVNRFRLYDGDMRPLDDGKLRDFYVTGNHNTTLHPENLLVHLPIKDKAGIHFLEVMTTEESQVASKEFPYLRFEQQAVYPMLTTRFDIMRPPANLLVSLRGECALDTLHDRLRLTMTKPVWPLESRFFSTPPEFSMGFSASAFSTWHDVGNAYWNSLVAVGLSPDSIPFLVREKAGEICSSNLFQSSVKALFRYVRDSIHYNNFEFSLQAQIPQASDITLQKGQADCKAHALLLVHMLRSQGYAADLFLVDLDHAGEPEHPSLNQFNHMIVYVPPQKGMAAAFLDPTDKSMAFRRSPLELEGRIGLIVNPENSRLLSIPEIDSGQEHSAQVFHRFAVNKDGVALGSDSVVLTGKLAGWFRDHYNHWNPATRMQTLMSWMSEGYPPFVERGFRLSQVDNPDEPLSLVFRYETRFALQKGQREIEHFPKLELSFLRFPPPKLCRQPVYFANEVVIQSEWIYHLPDGFVWKTTDIDREVNANSLQWKFSIQQNVPETILIRQRWQVEPFIASPEEYGRNFTEWSPILARAGLSLVATKP